MYFQYNGNAVAAPTPDFTGSITLYKNYLFKILLSKKNATAITLKSGYGINNEEKKTATTTKAHTIIKYLIIKLCNQQRYHSKI